MSKDKATGPLSGVRIVEFAGIGPGPYASMMLADMGADVVHDRAARPVASMERATDGARAAQVDST